jgi:hypothetical protein
MSTVLTPVECNEFEVKLIGALPEKEPEFQSSDAGTIVCLDLSVFNLERAVSWIRKAREIYREQPDDIIPCFVVIGSTSRLSLTEVYELERRLLSVGAAFYERPKECRTFKEAMMAFGRVADRIYKKFYRDEEGFFRPKSDSHFTRIRERGQSPSRARRDLSAYINPATQLSAEDFQRLIRRMDQPDSSGESED